MELCSDARQTERHHSPRVNAGVGSSCVAKRTSFGFDCGWFARNDVPNPLHSLDSGRRVYARLGALGFGDE